MNAIALPRMVLSPLVEKNTPDPKVLLRAQRELDYNFRDHDAQQARFLAELACYGVIPFQAQAVEDYKEKMRAKYIAKHGSVMQRLGVFKSAVDWRTCGIRDYPLEIPQSVLELALHLKSNGAYKSLCIEYLSARDYRQERADRERDLDPFLVVFGPSKIPYHIAVWDEPTFKG